MKKILKYILIGVSVFIAIVGIEFGIVYAVQGDNIWKYLKEVWDWYKTIF